MCDTSLKEFSKAMIDFVSSTERLAPVEAAPDSKRAVDRICGLLGIAKLELSYKIPDNANRLFLSDKTTTIFLRDNWDESRPFTIVKRHEDNCVFTFSIYPHKDGKPWDDEDKSRISTFISQVYLVNDRARIAETAEKYSVMDNEMELYNLRYLMKTMGMLFAKREIFDYCACRFNIAGLAIINSKIGRSGGTEMMKRYIYGLRDLIGADGFISRLGGDNFISLFRKSKTDAVIRYLSGVKLRTEYRGIEELFMSAHAGYYCVDERCRGPHEIMESIITAEIAARMNPKASYAIFDDELKKRVEAKKQLEGLFYDAIDKEEFLIYYQPKVNLQTYTISGAEALCRWQHDGQLIPPIRFIPILEQSHNICILDFYMLEHVCRDMRKWMDSGMPLVKVSVNLSRMNLGDERLAERIMETVDRYGVPHEYIEIELTETTTDVDFKELKKVVSSLHGLGISTSVDDFGVGYSSLNLIRDLPWNVLKIDKSFLPEETDENKEDKKIMLKHVIEMAQELGLECIVEGVESINQVELLKGCSCFRAQGYLFDKPLPTNVFEERLRDGGKYVPESN
ncbi:MAG: EAL domain-containing protein [Lachnospiraceae bacterium]|nr:EAL domain-containing protein [Ruminococcus sp.]MCM1274809.1 EAL domain-containing protein [Lachnospiraceae bacterium]